MTSNAFRNVQQLRNYIDLAAKYGVRGDNSTDNTAAINQAVIDHPTSTLVLPSGIVVHSAEILIASPRLTLIGQGIDSTILRQTSGTANGLNFNYPISFGLPTGGGVRDLTIESGAGFSSAAFYGAGSSGVGLRVRNASDNFTVTRVGVNNYATGCALLHCWNTRWSANRVLFCSGDALLIDQDSGNIGAGNSFQAMKLSNAGYAGTATSSHGIRVRASGGEWFWGVDAGSFQNGVLVDPTSAQQQVLYLFFDTVLADTSLGDGWVFDGSQQNLWSVQLHNCWGAFGGGSGMKLLGAKLDSVRSVGGRWRENVGHGVWLAGGTNLAIHDAEIASNSRTASGVNHGVQVDANVSGWSVEGNRIGNFASTLATQQNGVNISGGTTTNFRVCNNDLRGNLGVPVNDTTSATEKKMSGNLPVVSLDNPSDAQSFSGGSVTTVAANSTVYLGAAGQTPNSADAPFLPIRNGLVMRIFASVAAAPGTGQTFTYTLMVNGVASSLTFQIAGAATNGQVGSAAITVNASDLLDLRLQTSATATVTKHRFFISAA